VVEHELVKSVSWARHARVPLMFSECGARDRRWSSQQLIRGAQLARKLQGVDAWSLSYPARGDSSPIQIRKCPAPQFSIEYLRMAFAEAKT